METQTVRFEQSDPAALRSLLAPPGRTAPRRLFDARHQVVDEQPELANRLAVDGGRCQRPQRCLHAYLPPRFIDHLAAAVPGGDPGIQPRSPIRPRRVGLNDNDRILIRQGALKERIEGIRLDVVDDRGLDVGRRRLMIRPGSSDVAATECRYAKQEERQEDPFRRPLSCHGGSLPSAGRTVAARTWLPQRFSRKEWRGYA